MAGFCHSTSQSRMRKSQTGNGKKQLAENLNLKITEPDRNGRMEKVKAHTHKKKKNNW